MIDKNPNVLHIECQNAWNALSQEGRAVSTFHRYSTSPFLTMLTCLISSEGIPGKAVCATEDMTVVCPSSLCYRKLASRRLVLLVPASPCPVCHLIPHSDPVSPRLVLLHSNPASPRLVLLHSNPCVTPSHTPFSPSLRGFTVPHSIPRFTILYSS